MYICVSSIHNVIWLWFTVTMTTYNYVHVTDVETEAEGVNNLLQVTEPVKVFLGLEPRFGSESHLCSTQRFSLPRPVLQSPDPAAQHWWLPILTRHMGDRGLRTQGFPPRYFS